MNTKEAQALTAKAAKLFKDLTPEMLKLLCERILPFDKISIETALKNHRVSHEFFSFPQFMEGCRAERNRSQNRISKYREETVASWLANGRPFNASSGGAAVTKHFSDAWAKVKDDEKSDDHGKQTIRRMIRGHALNALRELGWPESDCQDRANACVGLEPGERIVVTSFKAGFGTEPPAEPQAQIAALASLAGEEGGAK